MENNNKLKIAFAGTPPFAAVTLQKLLQHDFNITAVFTQPDRPKGRGKKLAASLVKEIALNHQLPVLQPLNFKDEAAVSMVKDLNIDLLIVVAYGLILPQAVLHAPRYGCINVHASLLPRWRGAAPIQRAIVAGDDVTGVTIMQMDTGLDTGPMLLTKEIAITSDDTAATLTAKLAELGADALIEALNLLQKNKLTATPQPEVGVTYAHKITKEEAKINWQQPAAAIVRHIRGFNPQPAASATINNENIKILAAEVIKVATTISPGTIITADKNQLIVATGDNNQAISITELQLPGSKAMPIKAALNSKREWFLQAGAFA